MAEKPSEPRRAQAMKLAHFRRQQGRYENDLKCCTFHPYLPNYAVGAILADTSLKNQFGRQVIQRRVKEQTQILPLGIPAPREYQIDFLKNKSRFGKEESLLCPYFNSEQNQCGLWIYRGSVCTSFFCASDHAWGLKFWDELVLYLSLVEISLAELVLERLGMSSREVMQGFDLIDLGKIKPSRRSQESLAQVRKLQKSAFWSQNSSPEEFYLSCYQTVLKMTQKEFENEMGDILESQKKNVLSKFKGYRTKPAGDR